MRDNAWSQVYSDLEDLNERMENLLTQTANALKGPPRSADVQHHWDDLPEIAARIVAERDELAERVAAYEALLAE